MHRTNPDGTVIESLCDYCLTKFDQSDPEQPPMIEGHQGALICLRCLSVAYAEVVGLLAGHEHSGSKCTMCLEDRKQPQWASPMADQTRICLRCIKQASTAIEKDPDVDWKRPS